MDQNEKFPGYTGIWDSANQARDIHLALMFALASTALADGWEALWPHIPSRNQGEPEQAAERKKAAAS